MDYVFVLDISGSMNDDGKLDLSRRSLRRIHRRPWPRRPLRGHDVQR